MSLCLTFSTICPSIFIIRSCICSRMCSNRLAATSIITQMYQITVYVYSLTRVINIIWLFYITDVQLYMMQTYLYEHINKH